MRSNEVESGILHGTVEAEIAAALVGGAPMGKGLPAILPPVGPEWPILPPAEQPEWTPFPEREYTRPSYSGRFQCIASACEDTCCKGWAVPIDQKTYEKYESMAEMKQHMGTLVVLANEPTPVDYARINLTTQGECAFLDEARLCGIQKKHGAGMLSVTCATYPRAISTQVGQVEEALNLSCPEAARVTLLDANLLGGAPWQTHGAGRYATLQDARSRAAFEVQGWGVQRPGRFEPRLAVREFALAVLGDRRYPLWQRLALLRTLVRGLQVASETDPKTASVAAWCEANPVKVSQMLTDVARVAVLETTRPAMDEMVAQPEQQLLLVMELMRLRMADMAVPPRFIECVQDFEAGLGCATATSPEQIVNAYEESTQRYYRPFMERHPQVMENYLINLVFKNGYPFGAAKNSDTRLAEGGANAEIEHLALCMHAAVAQTLLIGMTGHYRERFDLGHVVKLVQSLAKTIEHSKQSIEQVRVFVETRKLNSQHGIALLLRVD